MTDLPLADPEVAAATFKAHLDELWSGGRPGELGWKRIDVDPLHAVIELPAKRADHDPEPYLIRLGAEYYDPYPPEVTFILLDSHEEARTGSRWFPRIEGELPFGFGLHDAYGFRDSRGPRQLVCFSQSLGFYQSDHNPTAGQRWQQGRHTLAVTLYRLHEVLQAPYYKRPSSEPAP